MFEEHVTSMGLWEIIPTLKPIWRHGTMSVFINMWGVLEIVRFVRNSGVNWENLRSLFRNTMGNTMDAQPSAPDGCPQLR
jgi:hypothetical protein